MKPQHTTVFAVALFLAVIAGLVGLTWANYQFARQNPGGNDFLARWLPARAWAVEGRNPYDPAVSLETQEMIYGRPADASRGEDLAHFVYPLHSMLFFVPFSLLDYTLARALWMTVLELSLGALALTSLRLAGWQVRPLSMALLVLFALFWYHGVRTVIVGQFAGLNALLIALALLLIQQRADFVAGILLALATAKPQMVYLLLPFVLLWAYSSRRMDLVWGILLSGGVLLAGSLILLPGWPFQWVGQLLEYPSYTARIGSPLSVIADAVPGIRDPVNIFLHVIFYGYLFTEWFMAWKKHERWFLWTALLTIVITNLVAYRTATTNFVMMLPGLFVVFKLLEERWSGGGRWAVILSLLLLGVGLWALFLGTIQGNEEAAALYLPLPFFALLGLWWVRWWLIRPPRTTLDEITQKTT